MNFYTDESVCSLHRFEGFHSGPKTTEWKDLPAFIEDLIEAFHNQVNDEYYDGFELYDEYGIRYYKLWASFEDPRDTSFIMSITNGRQTEAEKYFKKLVNEHGYVSFTSPRPGNPDGSLTMWITTLGNFKKVAEKLVPRKPQPKEKVRATKIVKRGGV